MSRPTITESGIDTLCIYPRSGTGIENQLKDCYSQFTEKASEFNFPITSIVKQTVFISAINDSDYIQSKQKILSCAKDFFENVPPTSVISQSPENSLLIVEFTLIGRLLPQEITFRHSEESSWIVVNRGGMKIVVATGCSKDEENGDILQQSTSAFNCLQNILSEEKMNFADVIRQWNYIEQITKISGDQKSTNQNYQVFNDVRSKFYRNSDFQHGYPAATGIGMDCGGIAIDIIAARFDNKSSVVALKSPVQLDAYNYSKAVLAENNSMADFCRTTPKFERAKVLITSGGKTIFVSGTAAIKGQSSISELSAEVQTEMTIQNILTLISPKNLTSHGIAATNPAKITHLRVYIKFRRDINIVKSICQKHFPHVPAVFIIADICRPELLVEIEGQAVVG